MRLDLIIFILLFFYSDNVFALNLNAYTNKDNPDMNDELIIYDSSDESTKNILVGSIPGANTGWRDGGSYLYLTTTTDSIAIGTTSPVSGFNLNVSGNQYVSGNIGIGTTSPRGNLDANQSIYVGTSGPGYIASTEGIGLDGNKDTNIDVFINSSGNVGIGTSNPGYIFETVSSSTNSFNRMIYTGAQSNIGAPVVLFVADPTAAMTSGSNLGRIIFGGATNISHSIGNGASIEAFAGGTFSPTSLPSYLSFKVAPSGSTTRTEMMRITPTSVGIGTTALASDTLVVKSPATNGTDEAIKVHANGSATSIVLIDEPSANKARLRLRESSTTSIQFDVNSDSYINAGNLGIGTSVPQSKIHMNGATGVGQLTLDGDTGGCLMFRDTDNGGWSECDILDGTMSCSTDTDGICD